MKAQDGVWLLLFAALAALSPRQGATEVYLLAALALTQVLGPRIPALEGPGGNVALILSKLLLGFLLIGVTGGIVSSYSLILLLPVVSAATTLGPAGTIAVTALACGADLVFLPVAWNLGYRVDPGLIRDLILRALFLPVVSFLTFTLAQAGRLETRRAQEAARSLAEVNERLLRAEESARRAERLAALGQLSAGLAHELRNPIGTIRASSEMLARRIAADDPVASELAGYIASEVDRTNSLITRFLDFARPLEPRFELCDLNAILDGAVEHLQRERPEAQLPIHRNFEPGIPPLRGDRELLERLFFNLIQNAVAVTPPGALVTLKSRSVQDVAEATVLDRGPGIEKNLHEKIFNPFFTTRPSGTGLGLSICAKIAAEHGGAIRVESEPGSGAAFVVTLPLGGPAA